MPRYNPKMNSNVLVARSLRDARVALFRLEKRVAQVRSLKRLLTELLKLAGKYEIVWEEIVPDGVLAHPQPGVDQTGPVKAVNQPKCIGKLEPVTRLTLAFNTPGMSTWIERGRIITVGPLSETLGQPRIEAPQAPLEGHSTKEVIAEEKALPKPETSQATIMGQALNPRILTANLPDGRHITVLKPNFSGFQRLNKGAVVTVTKANGFGPEVYQVVFPAKPAP